MDTRPNARAIAFYLPQFHQTPENDQWWGRGFTEWTNVRAARRLFAGHRQPVRPGKLGYYSLLDPEIRSAQASLAQQHGIEGFCYWHYWFGGRRMLQAPFNAVLSSGQPRFPFCLAWANHDWTAAWVGRPYELLMRQTYPGRDDYRRHYVTLRAAFEDPRYITLEGKPLFLIFRPKAIPDANEFTDLLREWAHRDGFPGLYMLGILDPLIDPRVFGLDGSVDPGIGALVSQLPRDIWLRSEVRRRSRVLIERPGLGWLHQGLARAPHPPVFGTLASSAARRALLPLVHPYSDVIERATASQRILSDRYPCAVPNWDNTPRMGRWGVVLHDSTPEAYSRHLRHAVRLVADRPSEHRLVFLKSWNEWAEGNYLEPDMHHGSSYLEATLAALFSSDEFRRPALGSSPH